MIKKIALLLWIVLLIVAALPQLWYPYGFDQMVYAACGDVIRRGGLAIRDCFETKQPGVMMMFALPALFTRAPMAAHGLTLLWQAGTAILIALIAQRMWRSPAAGIAAASIYWLMYAGINYWSMDQAETFANGLLLLAVWHLWQNCSSGSRRDAFIAGVLIGIVFWFKLVFALVGVVVGAVWLIYQLRLHWGWRVPFKVAIYYALGVFGVIALVLAIYALAPGGLDALIEQTTFLRENFPLAEPLPLQGIAQQLLRFLDNGADVSGGQKATLGEALERANVLGGGFPILIGLALIGAIGHLIMRLATLRRRAPNDLRGASFGASALLAYAIAALAIVAWQGNYIQYHYTLLHVPVALLAGSALALPARLRAPIFSAVLLACGLLLWRLHPLVLDAWQNIVVEGKSRTQMYLESRQGVHIGVAEYVAANTGPDDSISIIGDAPWIYTLADRRNATRHAFVNVWSKKPGNPSHARFTAQWVDGLARNQPKLILLAKDNFPWPNNSTIDDYKRNTVLQTYVEANYRYIGEVGPFLMFQRR